MGLVFAVDPCVGLPACNPVRAHPISLVGGQYRSEMCRSWNFGFTSAQLNRQASATASAFTLPATAIRLKIDCTSGPALTSVACAKNCRYNWNLVVLLLPERRNVAVKKFFFSESVRKDIKNCVRTTPTPTKCFQMRIPSAYV